MYTCSNWSLIKQFQVATTDLEDIAWSPDAACLVAWDTCLSYSLTVFTPEGETLAKYSAYSNALGVKTVQWAPSGQMLIIGSFDQVSSVAQKTVLKEELMQRSMVSESDQLSAQPLLKNT